MFCAECGARTTDTARFCPACGTPTSGRPPPSNVSSGGDRQGADAAISRHAARIVAGARRAVKGLGSVPSSSEPASNLLCEFVYLGVQVTMMLVGAEGNLEDDETQHLLSELATTSVIGLVEAEPGIFGTPDSITDDFVERVSGWAGLPLTTDEGNGTVMRGFLQRVLVLLGSDQRPSRNSSEVTGYIQEFLRDLDIPGFIKCV